MKKYYIIGRAFSGDEIFFVTDDMDDNIDLIQNVCFRNNLTFTYIEDKHKLGEDVSFTLEKMIENFH